MGKTLSKLALGTALIGTAAFSFYEGISKPIRAVVLSESHAEVISAPFLSADLQGDTLYVINAWNYNVGDTTTLMPRLESGHDGLSSWVERFYVAR
jgi:hypothetical protein